MYDVFISYRHVDADRVRAMAAALESSGLRVWIDETRIEDFTSIQSNIESGLAKSKALLAWYSTRYPESRACQWELTAALLAAQQEEKDVRKRILLVNPENESTHIYPVELRDTLYRSGPDTSEDLQALVDVIGARVGQLTGVLGEIRSRFRPEWYGGASGYGSNRFVGRLRELWEIHSGLTAAALPIITGSPAKALVRLVGLGGAGKSLLAEEYGLRFSAAYPGGVFWLKAFGHDNTRSMEAGEREVERQLQFAGIAESLGKRAKNLTAAQVRAELAETLEQRGAYLWIVDDLPSGMGWDKAQLWLAPSQGGYTLATTRAGGYDWLGTLVEILELEPGAAYSLITQRRPPRDEREATEARALSNELGCHPLALELTAVLAQRRGYAAVRRELADPSEDVLEFAADLFGKRGGTLPHRDPVNVRISSTLLISIDRLSEEGRDFLRLAAQLAPAPISRDLIAPAFAAAYGLSANDAEKRADLAMEEADSSSLARQASEQAVIVHTLVSRTVRFRDDAQDRHRNLRRGVADALVSRIQNWTGRLPGDIDHARTVILAMLECATDLKGEEIRSLVTLLARIYPYTRDVAALWQKALDICCRVLGERDPHTLIAMNRLALWLYGDGDPDDALDMQEKVLELSRALRGENHPDTRIALANVVAQLTYDMDRFKSHDRQECSKRLQTLLKQQHEFHGPVTGTPSLLIYPV